CWRALRDAALRIRVALDTRGRDRSWTIRACSHPAAAACTARPRRRSRSKRNPDGWSRGSQEGVSLPSYSVAKPLAVLSTAHRTVAKQTQAGAEQAPCRFHARSKLLLGAWVSC